MPDHEEVVAPTGKFAPWNHTPLKVPADPAVKAVQDASASMRTVIS